MDLKQLRYFLAVAREQSFTRAAERLHMAQPPLSRRVQDIELELGLKLFDRESRPLKLTPAGKLLFEHASQVVLRMDQLDAAMARFAAAQKLRFNIGLTASTLYTRFPEVVRRFRALAPEVDVGMAEMDTPEQVAALREGRINAAFDRIEVDDPSLQHRVLREEPLVAVLPSDHPRLQDPAPIRLEEIAAMPLILYPREPRPGLADKVLALFSEKGLLPEEVQEVRELQSAIVMTAAGGGVCLAPETLRRLGRGDVGFLPLAEPVSLPVILRTRRDEHSATLDLFQSVLIDLFTEWGFPPVPPLEAPGPA